MDLPMDKNTYLQALQEDNMQFSYKICRREICLQPAGNAGGIPHENYVS